MKPESPTNPFSTCRVRPGQLDFHFPASQDAHQLVDRLRAQKWRGQIVGRHGVGKTTLLEALLPELAAAGRTVACWTLRGGQRRWPAEMAQAADAWDATTLVIVDGYEQFNAWARWRLHRRCRAARAGLLVTSHRDAGLPTLVDLTCSADMVQILVAKLLRDDPVCISPDEVSHAYAAHQGNVREVFFTLYDLYESRRAPVECEGSTPVKRGGSTPLSSE